MILSLEDLSPNQIYYTLIQSIVPRPIAWVLSKNANETHNMAPFYFFNGVFGSPPIASIAAGRKDDGTLKDTWNNIENRSDFVIHIAHIEMADVMTASAASLNEGESEIDFLGLETEAVSDWPIPRLKESRIALLCERFAIHEVGEPTRGLILGKVLAAYIANEIATKDGKRLTPKSWIQLGGSVAMIMPHWVIF